MNNVALAVTGICTAWTALGTLAVIRATRGQRLPESIAKLVEDPLPTLKTEAGIWYGSLPICRRSPS